MIAPEFSRLIALETIGTVARGFEIVADEPERAALARRFDLIELKALRATLAITAQGDRISLSGQVDAQVVQACVVTGEALSANIGEAFCLRFVPPRAEPGPEELELDNADLDTVIHDGTAIDAGEAVAQSLALAVEPFPRSKAAEHYLAEKGRAGEDQRPFAGLKGLIGSET